MAFGVPLMDVETAILETLQKEYPDGILVIPGNYKLLAAVLAEAVENVYIGYDDGE